MKTDIKLRISHNPCSIPATIHAEKRTGVGRDVRTKGADGEQEEGNGCFSAIGKKRLADFYTHTHTHTHTQARKQSRCELSLRSLD